MEGDLGLRQTPVVSLAGLRQLDIFHLKSRMAEVAFVVLIGPFFLHLFGDKA
jgi:hypothetical protein